jgi:hypothetical protein
MGGRASIVGAHAVPDWLPEMCQLVPSLSMMTSSYSSANPPW